MVDMLGELPWGAALPEALATTARAKKRQLTARGFCNMVWGKEGCWARGGGSDRELLCI